MVRFKAGKKCIGLILLVVTFLIGWSDLGRAAVPPTMNFQGYLTNPAGKPIQGTLPMVFSLYSQEAGGAVLWTETHADVPVTNGVYNVILGSVTPIALDFIAQYYLGIQIGSDPEMIPRLPLSSVGYSFRAGTAEQALIQGFPVSPVVPSANQMLKFNGTNWVPSAVNLDTDTVGVLPLMLGGTGSDTQNFVDLSTNQTIGGVKNFSQTIGSNVPPGTPPFQVGSTTLVPNLNAEMISGKKLADLDTRFGVAMAPSLASRLNTINSIDTVSGMDYDTSIAIGTDGFPVVVYSYYDPTSGAFKVAKCGDPACNPALATLRILDVTGNVGYDTSIAIGADGFPVISYVDGTNGDLKVAKCGDPSCDPVSVILRTLDTAGNVGSASSIAIGADGFPILSYYDGTNGGLKTAKCGDASCDPASATLRTLDTSGGYYTSLAVGTDGFPVISYYDAANGDLKVAKCGDASCNPASAAFRTVDSIGNVGWHNAIAIGVDGFPVISYMDGTNAALKVAKCGDASCDPTSVTLRTIAATGGGYYTGIAIGVDGFPIISYMDGANGDLQAAKCADPSCDPASVSLRTIDATGWVGMHTAIAIGVDGFPVISYMDYTNDVLKVTKCANPYCLNNWWRR